jgi:hypothetical protein
MNTIPIWPSLDLKIGADPDKHNTIFMSDQPPLRIVQDEWDTLVSTSLPCGVGHRNITVLRNKKNKDILVFGRHKNVEKNRDIRSGVLESASTDISYAGGRVVNEICPVEAISRIKRQIMQLLPVEDYKE